MTVGIFLGFFFKKKKKNKLVFNWYLMIFRRILQILEIIYKISVRSVSGNIDFKLCLVSGYLETERSVIL